MSLLLSLPQCRAFRPICFATDPSTHLLKISLADKVPCYNCCYHGVLQSGSLAVCDVDESLKEKLKKFRFRKETTNAAIISKCQIIIIETEWDKSLNAISTPYKVFFFSHSK